MLRKIFSLGALVMVALTFGVGTAAAKPPKGPSPSASHCGGHDWQEGFSDGRD